MEKKSISMNVISAIKTVFNVDDNLITGGDDKSGSDNKARGPMDITGS